MRMGGGGGGGKRVSARVPLPLTTTVAARSATHWRAASKAATWSLLVRAEASATRDVRGVAVGLANLTARDAALYTTEADAVASAHACERLHAFIAGAGRGAQRSKLVTCAATGGMSKVGLVVGGGVGRGAGVRAGDPFLTLPATATLNSGRARADTALGPVLGLIRKNLCGDECREVGEGGVRFRTNDVLLSLLLERARGTRSTWAAPLELLPPPAALAAPRLHTSSELRVLAGSASLSRILLLRAESARAFPTIRAIGIDPFPVLWGADAAARDAAASRRVVEWALATVHARGFLWSDPPPPTSRRTARSARQFSSTIDDERTDGADGEHNDIVYPHLVPFADLVAAGGPSSRIGGGGSLRSPLVAPDDTGRFVSAILDRDGVAESFVVADTGEHSGALYERSGTPPKTLGGGGRDCVVIHLPLPVAERRIFDEDRHLSEYAREMMESFTKAPDLWGDATDDVSMTHRNIAARCGSVDSDAFLGAGWAGDVDDDDYDGGCSRLPSGRMLSEYEMYLLSNTGDALTAEVRAADVLAAKRASRATPPHPLSSAAAALENSNDSLWWLPLVRAHVGGDSPADDLWTIAHRELSQSHVHLAPLRPIPSPLPLPHAPRDTDLSSAKKRLRTIRKARLFNMFTSAASACVRASDLLDGQGGGADGDVAAKAHLLSTRDALKFLGLAYGASATTARALLAGAVRARLRAYPTTFQDDAEALIRDSAAGVALGLELLDDAEVDAAAVAIFPNWGRGGGEQGRRFDGLFDETIRGFVTAGGAEDALLSRRVRAATLLVLQEKILLMEIAILHQDESA